MTQDQLIKKCIKNNRAAQSELFKQYKDTLYFLSLKYCRNQADAEDNLHDSFMTIFDKIKNYRHGGSFEGWMKRITIFKAIDKYKTKKPLAIEINDDILTDNVTIEKELAYISIDTLLSIIQELPDQYRLVFNLYQLDGFSHKEISVMLNITESTSKSNYHRAKLKLRDKINAFRNTPNAKAYEN
ncbi:DNA-directed RNA polymerase sigma-70 factor [Patiriisocius marinistellae]|uniref:DNA-directed RNA polymerase sigma-70 factor n=1 Tax=Patiriisocius marinistellae TaxID=2494560 RepID=A0A5J4G3R4_9FLAO|nr:RNA polymerase sigma factor [Patiriisocius marinistellae]GEQ87021.1 DNA-directed RNA polymerase sigma-70 factor [Patiriisocius marinistellae]